MREVPVKCVFLDMGRVLLDFDHRILGERLHQMTALSMEEIRSAFAAPELAVQYETGKMSDAEFHREICRRMGKEIAFEDFASAWNSIFHPVPLVPESILVPVAARSRLWIISNTNHLHFAHLRQKYTILSIFHGFILSHEVGAMKPDSEIFSAALERTGFSAAESVFVDDQLVNVEAARNLGFDAFQFRDAEHFRVELDKRLLL